MQLESIQLSLLGASSGPLVVTLQIAPYYYLDCIGKIKLIGGGEESLLRPMRRDSSQSRLDPCVEPLQLWPDGNGTVQSGDTVDSLLRPGTSTIGEYLAHWWLVPSPTLPSSRPCGSGSVSELDSGIQGMRS